MDFSQHWASWTILVTSLGILVYTLVVIKEEKASFIENAKVINFGPFLLKVPSWWDITELPERTSFKRSDTRYEWTSYIEFHSPINPVNDLTAEMIGIVQAKKIEMDEIHFVHESPSAIESNLFFKDKKISVVHVEGTATEGGINRIYFDAYLIRENQGHKVLYAESKSSVLNGLVEGPYFEEAICKIELI